MDKLEFWLGFPPDQDIIVDIFTEKFTLGRIERQEGNFMLDVYNHPKKKDWKINLEPFWVIYEEYKDRLTLCYCNGDSNSPEDLTRIETDLSKELDEMTKFEYALGFPPEKEGNRVDNFTEEFIFGKIEQQAEKFILTVDNHPQKDGWRIDLETLSKAYEQYKEKNNRSCDSQLVDISIGSANKEVETMPSKKQGLFSKLFKG